MHAEVLTVNSILTAQKAGAPSDGIVLMVNSPTNTVAMSAGDLVTLRDAGVSERVIAAVWARVPVPAPTPVPLVPDDARLVDLVRLSKSGISESIVAEQVKEEHKAKPKPDNVVEKIVEGKMGKFFQGICLMEQPFVKEPDLSIEAYLKSVIASIKENISIRRFTRFQLGEHIAGEKPAPTPAE